MIRPRHFILAVCALALSACAAQKQAVVVPQEKPVQTAFRDPGDDVFMAAIADYVRATGGPPNSRYEFTRVDLDGDGRRDGILLLHTPFESWCNRDGCRMAVFKANNDSFSLVSEIGAVRGPLVVSDNRTNGWRDLLVRVSGRFDMAAKTVALKYGSSGYPARPDAEPPVLASALVFGGGPDGTGGITVFP